MLTVIPYFDGWRAGGSRKFPLSSDQDKGVKGAQQNGVLRLCCATSV
jgi:hypothetical protein